MKPYGLKFANPTSWLRVIMGSCFIFRTWLPVVFTIFARFYGAPLGRSLHLPQSIGLEFNVRAHRLCTRNMNYYIEHHMHSDIPLHTLPKLHEKIRNPLPPAYPSRLSAYQELITTILRKQKARPTAIHHSSQKSNRIRSSQRKLEPQIREGSRPIARIFHEFKINELRTALRERPRKAGRIAFTFFAYGSFGKRASV